MMMMMMKMTKTYIKMNEDQSNICFKCLTNQAFVIFHWF